MFAVPIALFAFGIFQGVAVKQPGSLREILARGFVFFCAYITGLYFTIDFLLPWIGAEDAQRTAIRTSVWALGGVAIGGFFIGTIGRVLLRLNRSRSEGELGD